MIKILDICYNHSRRKRVRVVEGARLERVYTAMYRRFESSRFRQEVKRPVRVFLFLRRRNEDSSPGSHGTKRHPLILSLPEGMKKRPARVFFISSKKKRGFEPKVRMERLRKKDTTKVAPFLNNIFIQP